MGDPVCLLAYTCLACGLFLEPVDREQDRCRRCGAVLSETGDGLTDHMTR